MASTFICRAISLATLLSGKLCHPQYLEHGLPLSSVQEILVKRGVAVPTSRPSAWEVDEAAQEFKDVLGYVMRPNWAIGNSGHPLPPKERKNC